MSPTQVQSARLLSPRRNTTQAASASALAMEQLSHFGINPNSEQGQLLGATAQLLYSAQANIAELWQLTQDCIDKLDRSDRIAFFNAKRFMSFQLAKLLDTLQNPMRKSFQSLQGEGFSSAARGGYPLFDNVPAIFSATPVIVRTATYIYACTEWIDDAFQGKEPTHQIYSRLLNPTSISLANTIVDLECGPHAGEYLAWNFNSGMAAIDALLSNQLRHGDILIVSRNIYGGVHQLLQDHFARKDKMAIELCWFDGYSGEEFQQFMDQVLAEKADQLAAGKRAHVYLESPCNPHGYMLDVPAICRIAHEAGLLVSLDSTLATPILYQPLQRKEKIERPDFVVHSYTKDISGSGAATAGVVIGENHRMFIPKGDSVGDISWEQTMFWDVYYIKGAFLDADKAFEVLQGIRTLELRMVRKGINATCLARFLASHPDIRVNSHAVPENENSRVRAQLLRHGLPSALFTIDMEAAQIPVEAFKRFFDMLEPAFSQQVSIGQTNTMVLCPALTSHSELSPEAMRDAAIYPTTTRISVGDENVAELIAHFIHCARMHLDPAAPGFSEKFMATEEADALFRSVYMEIHGRIAEAMPGVETYLS